MAGKSNIEWTQHTWNPIVGCSIVSPGCTNCYAMRMARRIDAMSIGAPLAGKSYGGLTKVVNGKAVWTGALRLVERALMVPLRRKKPTTYFVNSMGDLFHEDAPDEWIVKVLDVIRRTSWDGGSNCGTIRGRGEHTYQLLTKRAARMAAFMPRLRFDPHDNRGLYLSDDGKPSIIMKNLWLGVSCERQQEADERIPLLLQTPAAIRFISAEPLLSPIDLREYLDGHEDHGVDLSREPGSKVGACIGWTPPLDWVICGGESGPGARRMDARWARGIRDQCADANVPLFFKQWGAHDPETFDRVGKKAAGRLLDGQEHNAMPAGAA